MKKSFIALAVLGAFAGAASAQSNVTISGRVDLAIQKAPGQGARLNTANGTSRLLFAGTEDLGGGLKATFALQHRFNAESGTNDGSTGGRPFWQGESTVGLAGGFGAVKIGRALTAYRAVDNFADPWGTERVASVAITSVAADPIYDQNGSGAGRTDGIFYTSPNFGGFVVAATLGLKNQDTSIRGAAATTATENLFSLAAVYNAGPIGAAFGWEQNRADQSGWTLAGSYDFGVAKIMASYSATDRTVASDQKDIVLGASVPMGAATFKAGYRTTRPEGGGARDKKFGLGVDYSLSKRTTLYATVGKPNNTSASFDLGINHNF